MIEMRWLIVGDKPLHFPQKKVLQYRQFKDPHQYEDFGWSDWIDVPTVTENQQGN